MKGGVGKTTTLLLLASVYKNMNKKTTKVHRKKVLLSAKKAEKKEAIKKEDEEIYKVDIKDILVIQDDLDIEVGNFLGIAENIFVFNGKKAHEIVLFYEANIKAEDYKEKYEIIDEDDSYAIWVDIDKFVNKELIL